MNKTYEEKEYFISLCLKQDPIFKEFVFKGFQFISKKLYVSVLRKWKEKMHTNTGTHNSSHPFLPSH